MDDRAIDDAAAHKLTRVALWWGPVAVLVLTVGAWLVGVPSSGEARFWETTAQVAILVIYGVATLTARRWPMPWATVMTVAAFAIGALSNLEYSPWWGLLVALVLYVPAGLLWLAWQRTRPPPAVAALAAMLLVCLTGAGYAGTSIYDYFQGPQTEQSQRQPYPDTAVRWVWSGAATTTSFDVVARLDSDQTEARLVYGRSPDLVGEVIRTEPRSVDPDTNGVRFRVEGLKPEETYYYAVESGGAIDLARVGQVTTFADGPQTVTVAFASGIRGGSNAEAFETVRAADPDLFMVTGDLHYTDIAENQIVDFVRAYDGQLTPGAPQALYLAVPTVYMWDDHDYGPNDSDRTARSRPAAMASYRALVPHYPLALEGDQAPIAQAFTVGRVRFLITDLRSARDPKTDADVPGKTMMGATQLKWFEQELAQSAQTHALVVWMSSVPWIDRSDSPGDDWGAYPTERAQIANMIADNGIDNLVMMAGDAHMVAADDGSHSDFSDSGSAAFPVLQAAALDRQGSIKGGPYSHGAHPGPGQYGLLRVTDHGGDTVSISFQGRTWDGDVLLSLDRDFAVGD